MHPKTKAQLMDGVHRMMNSEDFKAMLKLASKFHTYSWSNQMLIWSQMPDATRVAGYQTWKKKLKRQVLKGAKAIWIMAPRPWAKTNDDGDQENGIWFKAVRVFDVSQTDGEPLPAWKPVELEGEDKDGLLARVEALISGEGLRLEDCKGSAYGWYDRQGKRIGIRQSLSPLHRTKTLVHELAHHFQEDVASNAHTESVAESTAFTVMNHFGQETNEYSFAYVATWAADEKVFMACLDRINKASRTIIDRLEVAA
jgi:hypothetical protein